MEYVPLSNISQNEEVTVVSIDCSKAMQMRLNDLGLMKGSTVQYLYPSVFGDPKAYRIRGAVLGLRNRDAAGILCRRREEHE